LFYVQKLKTHKYYGIPTFDTNPLQFEMKTSCNRLYLDGQNPLDNESPKQIETHDTRQQVISFDSDHADDLPF
jgi:hypothetical protein